MVLPHREIFPVLQPNLGFNDDQEDILSGLNNLAWKTKESYAQYMRTCFVLEEEEEKAIEIQVAIERNLLDQRLPLAPLPRRQ